MHRSATRLGLPLAAAASLIFATGAGSAFAASNVHVQASVKGRIQSVNRVHSRIKIDGRLFEVAPRLIQLLQQLEGKIIVDLKLNGYDKVVGVSRVWAKQDVASGPVTAISATNITLGTTTYALVSGAPIHYGRYLLTTAMVPLNTTATVELNSAGEVEAVWLASDANLPRNSHISGTITAVSSTAISLDGYTLSIAPNVVVRADGQNVSYTDVAINQKAMVQLNSQGEVDLIRLAGQGSVTGAVTADTASTITVGTNTYLYASDVQVRYRQYTLTPEQIPMGSTVVVRLNAFGQATNVRLQSDSNLPTRSKISGTISLVSGNTIDLAGYSLTMAPTFDVSFEGVSSLSNSVTAGEQASAWLNSSGQVARLVVGTNTQSQGNQGNS